MPRAIGDPQSKIVSTHLKEHERDALNEYLKEAGMTRYTWLRSLVLGVLVDEGYLELARGTRKDLAEGWRVVTKLAEE